MNKRPVSYLQSDSRWASKPYRTSGESSTIGSAGCGPTAAAMLITTLTGEKFTPEHACNWSMKHGFKALNQGTYYSYFVSQFKQFGIDCGRINDVDCYGKPNDKTHEKAFELLKKGYYLIALMGNGLWTRSGHFIVVWWADNKIRINDPASQNQQRENGNPEEFKSQVKYYWWIDARKYNCNEEDLDMTIDEVRSKLVDIANTGDAHSAWADECVESCIAHQLMSGDGKGNYGWDKLVTREVLAQVIFNLYRMIEAEQEKNKMSDKHETP